MNGNQGGLWLCAALLACVGWAGAATGPAALPPGTYRLRLKTVGNIDASASSVSPFYLNGRVVPLCRATSPAPAGGGKWAIWSETDPVTVKQGDAFYLKGDVAEWKTSAEPLKDAWCVLFDSTWNHRVLAASFEGSALERGNFRLALANRYGRPIDVKLEVEVTDYWQRELVRRTETVRLADTLTRDYPYATGSADSYRAKAVVTFPDGLRLVRRYFLRDFRTDTPHRWLDLNGAGWERALTTDDGTIETRILKDNPPATSAWQRVSLPDLVERVGGRPVYQRWYRRRFTLPKANEGERYVLHFDRPGGHRARVILNGQVMGENEVWQQGLPFVLDVTRGMRKGENELLVALQGATASCREEALATMKSVPRSEFYYGEGEHERGIVSECRLETTPARAMRGVPRVMTSFREKTVEVIDPVLPEGCTVSYRVLRQGREVIAPFHGKVKWENPILWGPDEFPLLELEATARDGAGAVVDRLSVRFGFREFWTEGMNFIVNGKSIRGVGRAMTPRFGRGTVTWQGIYDYLSMVREQGTVFHRHVMEVPQYYDFTDELGIYTSRSSHYCCSGECGKRFMENPAYWDYKRRNELELVDHFPNFASIYTWYISNEFGLAHNPKSTALMAEVVKAIKAKDPTRFVENGCDLDLCGFAEAEPFKPGLSGAISTHYPAHHSLRDESHYAPDGFYWRPLHDGTWFEYLDRVPKGMNKRVCNVNGASMIRWGYKPISVHETGWDAFMYYPHGPSQVYGEKTYVSTGETDREHVEYSQWYLQSHRDANCYMAVPWRGAQGTDPEQEMPSREAVIPLEYHAFYEGEPVTLDVDLFHDVARHEPLRFRWSLVGEDGAAVAGGDETHDADYGAMFRTKVAFAAPKAGRYELRYGVEGGPAHRRGIETFAKRPLACPGSAVLVRAEDPLDESVVAKARAGATVVVLARDSYPKALPFVPQVTKRDCAINFTFRRLHPALRNIREEDLRFWYPGHVTGRGYFVKPASGAVKTLVECGSADGFERAGVLEVPCGAGAVILTRLLLDEASRARNPLAQKLLEALLAYRPRNRAGRLGVLADEATLKRLRAWRVDCAPYAAGGDFAAVWVDGAKYGPEAVKGFDGAVFVEMPSAAWQVTHGTKLPRTYPGRAVKVQDEPDPILEGLNNSDFFWRRPKGFTDFRSGLLDKSFRLEDVGAFEILGGGTDLLYPRFLTRRGNVVFSSLNWRTGEKRLRVKTERIVTTLLANAGVGVRLGGKSGEQAAAKGADVDRRKLAEWNDAGDACLKKGDWAGAKRWFDKSLEADFNQPPIWESLKEAERHLPKAK